MRMKLALVAAALAWWASPAAAQLYFSQDNTGDLFRINTTTGQATLVGSNATGVTSNTVGLAESASAGVLQGSTWTDLSRINSDGSGFTNVGAISGAFDGAEGMAYDPVNNVLYASINGSFGTVNQATAVSSALAGPGNDVEGLAWAPGGTNGLIYGINRDNGLLQVYDIAGNAWTTVGDTGITWLDPGLAYDPGADVLYAIGDPNTDNLYRIDRFTAAATSIGALNLPGGTDGGGLAFISAVPEPTTVALVAIGMAGGAVSAWRGRSRKPAKRTMQN